MENGDFELNSEGSANDNGRAETLDELLRRQQELTEELAIYKDRYSETHRLRDALRIREIDQELFEIELKIAGLSSIFNDETFEEPLDDDPTA